jgi:uncharacterized protein YcfL
MKKNILIIAIAFVMIACGNNEQNTNPNLENDNSDLLMQDSFNIPFDLSSKPPIKDIENL